MRHRTESRRSAFTLIELLTVIAIIGALASMLLPAINSVRIAARKTTCAGQLRALTIATITYTTDQDGFLPAGGGYNAASVGNWQGSPQVAALMQYLDVTASNTVATTRALRCPGNRTGIIYPFSGGQAADFPATITRFDACAKRWSLPGGRSALWQDAAWVYDDGGGRNFNTACGHRGVRTGTLTGVPLGGNVSFADGSVDWAPYLGNTPSTDIAFVFNGGSIGGARAVPSPFVWIRLDSAGNIETARTDNLILGRGNRPFYSDANGNTNF